MQVIAQDLSLKGFSATRTLSVEFIVQGPDWDELTDATNKLMDAFKDSGYVTESPVRGCTEWISETRLVRNC